MGGNRFFWTFFGGIWLFVGVAFFADIAGINLFADPNALNQDMPVWIFAVAGAICSAAGGAIIYFARKTAAHDRRLQQAGVPLTATVLDIRRSMVEINRETRWHVIYRYEYAKGQPLDGQSHALSADAVWGFKPGDKVGIKVDPQKPEDSLFLGAA